MTTNKEYKERVEEKYGKPLKDVMYDLCVARNVVPTEGAFELEVPKSTFNYWRNYFRFGPNQRKFDMAEEMRKKEINRYLKELDDIHLEREFRFNNKQSLDGLKEIIERLLELEKFKRIKIDESSMADISILMNISTLESTLDYIEKYRNGDLYHEFVKELNFLKEK